MATEDSLQLTTTVADSADIEANRKSAAVDQESNRPKPALSPGQNCPICLGNIKNKSFTDGCFHMFCYICLLEWSRIKAECPLCKQKFQSIIYNVRSFDDFDQYFIVSSSNYALSQDQIQQAGRRFRYRTTRTEHASGFSRSIIARPGALPRPQSTFGFTATSAFRRRVYSRRLRVAYVPSLRLRNISPAFYAEHPTALHRLAPWLNRELNVLLHNRQDDVQFVLTFILDLVRVHDITSSTFHEQVRSFLGQHTNQFCEEFFQFARSPYDMVSYDKHVKYEAGSGERSSDSESDDERLLSTPDRVVLDDDTDPDDIICLNPITASSISSVTDVAGPATADVTGPSVARLRSVVCQVTRDTVPPASLSPVSQMRHGAVLLNPSSSVCRVRLEAVQQNLPMTLVRNEVAPSGLQVNELTAHDDRPSGLQQLGPSHDSATAANMSDNDSDVVFLGVEKPWHERSPVAVSSDDEDAGPASSHNNVQHHSSLPSKYRGNYSNSTADRRHRHRSPSSDYSNSAAGRRHRERSHSRERPTEREYSRHGRHRHYHDRDGSRSSDRYTERTSSRHRTYRYTEDVSRSSDSRTGSGRRHERSRSRSRDYERSRAGSSRAYEGEESSDRTHHHHKHKHHKHKHHKHKHHKHSKHRHD